MQKSTFLMVFARKNDGFFAFPPLRGGFTGILDNK
jgi:hypothetical protein